MMNHSVERTDTRIVDSDHSNSVHLSPGIPEESKLVADDQPPATGFYPYQDTDSPRDTTTTHCDDWRWETDAFSHPLLAGLFDSEEKIQIQLATTHPNRC